MGMSDALARFAGAFLLESLADAIRVESMEDERTFVLKDGAAMSMIRIDGALRAPGPDALADAAERLRVALSAPLAAPGHVIDFVFARDPQAARAEVAGHVGRARRAAWELGLAVGDVLDERERTLSVTAVRETLLAVVFTRPDAMSAEEAAEAARRRPAAPAARPHLAQMAAPPMLARHRSLVDALLRTLALCGQAARILDVSEGMREMRAALHPATAAAPDGWAPRLPAWAQPGRGPARFAMMPETAAQMAGRDWSNLFEPGFDLQLATEDCVIGDSRTVRIGDAAFCAFDMSLAPEILPAFNDLVLDMAARGADVPWRCGMRLEPGGLQSQALKEMFLSVFAFASPGHNGRIREAIAALREIDGRLDTVVRLRMSFATWAEPEDPARLRQGARTLAGAVQRWGNSRVDRICADPLATAVSTVPGATMASTAPVAAAPLGDALAMAPLARQASPWRSGALLLQTEDGRIWPCQPGSSRQASWVTLLVGAPGSGKSVALNALNLASAIAAAGGGEAALPRIAMIDVGTSSSGLVSLIREALPAERRHEAVFRRLRMSADDAVNPFDTQLGMRMPTASERAFLTGFAALACGFSDAAEGAMRGLIAACVERAYAELADEGAPRPYLRGDEPEVDRALDALGREIPPDAPWWEAVDLLMEAGRPVAASLAQRRAVPVFADLAWAAQTEQVASLYADALDPATGQPAAGALQRAVSEAVRDFPVLGGPTRLSLGAARIAALDLMDAAPAGGSAAARRQTAVVYMLARHALTRDFFLDEAEFRAKAREGALPGIYLEHHLARARRNLQLPKIICMDEFHRAGQDGLVCDQVLRDAREGRKHNVDLRIASQLIEDFPERIVQIASSLIVCGACPAASAERLDAAFALSESERETLRSQPSGPGPRGAPLWAAFRLKDEGTARQRLLLNLGPVELWAFSTTAEDMALRERLYERIGPRAARRALARRFPEGTAKAWMEARIAQLEERDPGTGERGRADLIDALVEELAAQATRPGDGPVDGPG